MNGIFKKTCLDIVCWCLAYLLSSPMSGHTWASAHLFLTVAFAWCVRDEEVKTTPRGGDKQKDTPLLFFFTRDICRIIFGTRCFSIPFFYKTPTCFRVLFNKYNKKKPESVTDEEGVTLARTRSRIRSIQKRLLLIQLLIKGRRWDWSGVGGRLELLYSISPNERTTNSQGLFRSDKPHRN